MRRLIVEINGLFGKVMADLIAEGQSDPAVLRELYEGHIRVRRASTVADIEPREVSGERRGPRQTPFVLHLPEPGSTVLSVRKFPFLEVSPLSRFSS
jgi:hypothetical protein